MAYYAAAVTVGSLGGAYLQSEAARSAANTQSDAALQTARMQQQMFEEQRADQEPWRQAGDEALGQLRTKLPEYTRNFTMADYQADPGYNFRMNQAMDAINKSAAAKGSLNSGATLKSLTRYGQDVASQEYQNAYNRFNNDRTQSFNRLSSIAGLGQTANGQIAQAGQNAANNIGNATMSAANATSAGQMAQANAWSGALSNLGNQAMNYQMMKRIFPQGGK